MSHWQGTISWSKAGVDFAIAKCSEGTYYNDPMYAQNKSGIRKAGILLGSYHFAGHGDPIVEADFFVRSVGDIQQGELLALDAESGQSPTWCKMFLDRVTSNVGFKPLIYCPANNGMDWSPVVKGNYGLWYARYNWYYAITKNPPIKYWPFYAIFQYSDGGVVNGIKGGVDLDYAKCNLETLKKYGKN